VHERKYDNAAAIGGQGSGGGDYEHAKIIRLYKKLTRISSLSRHLQKKHYETWKGGPTGGKLEDDRAFTKKEKPQRGGGRFFVQPSESFPVWNRGQKGGGKKRRALAGKEARLWGKSSRGFEARNSGIRRIQNDQRMAAALGESYYREYVN